MEILVLAFFGTFALLHLTEIWWKVGALKSYRFEVAQTIPKISLVVCAHNEKSNLLELVSILLNQSYSNYEILVILDRCNDGSQESIDPFKSEQLSILAIDEPPENFHPKKFGITEAIKAANGEWILLTDADCRPAKNWIAEMSTGMHQSTNVVIGLSPYRKASGLLNELIQYESFQTAFQFAGALALDRPYMGLGRNLAYRKSGFNEIGGFGFHRQIMGGDDDLLVQALFKKENYKLILSEESRVESIPKTDWSAYFRQKTRHFSVGKFYPIGVRKRETMRWIFHLFFWILSFISMYINLAFGLSILILTLLVKGLSINIAAQRIGKRFNPVWLPFVDLLYVVILPLISLKSLLSKNIAWK